MAMTALERTRRSLAKKAQLQKLAGDPSDKIATRRFHEYLPDDPEWNEVQTYLEWAGIKPDAIPTFDTDNDPDHDPVSDGPYRGSIGRAERMVGCLLDAASELAGIINRYKREEIDRAIARLESADLSDAEKRKQALEDVVRLTRYRDQLDKQVRWSLPQWRVTGT